jgi:hypothetical protein
MINAQKPDEQQLLQQVRSARSSGEVISATLTTDERVFARITDGIYREPASALRELIANAYDADATEVRISTDAPRFSRMVIRDNGHGLTEEALVHVICHIGGSLKRSTKGTDDKFNVTSASDANLSPAGRRLIGKLGIGLFSVSQLTHHLVIVTKVKNEPVRRVCDILLVPQSDVVTTPNKTDEDEVYVTGKALIKTIPADDVDSHGTEISLLEIRPFVRESLQSQALWNSISIEPGTQSEEDFEGLDEPNLEQITIGDGTVDGDDFYEKPPIPAFHIGRVSKRDPESLVVPPSFPWLPDTATVDKFHVLVDGVRGLAASTNEKIRLNEVLDTYFRTLWTLSLSVPLPYVQTDPFSVSGNANIKVFAVSNKGNRARAAEVDLELNETIREKLGLNGDADINPTPFSVIVDDIELKRPLEFGLQSDDESAAAPLLFVGKMRSDLSTVSSDYSGGPIEFEAYFYWQPKVVPIDHNGVMVRINGASGILFDDNFLKYQISEQTRLRQITAEIFVKQGLDAALNIDRESFNIAHTHYQVLKKWVHHALRQLMSAQKRVSGYASQSKLSDGLSSAVAELNHIVKEGRADSSSALPVIFSDTPLLQAATEGLVFDRATVFSPRKSKRSLTKTDKLKEQLLEQQIHAVASVLRDYGILETLSANIRDELLRKIVAIFSVDIRK